MGKRPQGPVRIEFPFQMDWYKAQPSTKFQSLQHRKKPYGFKHEFIVLYLDDGSICRIERMGDPDARFNALIPQGSVAEDVAQCFRPKNIDDAHLSTSDEIVAEITFPYKLDIMDVLKICRGIHEGEKTRNYTLQGYNCYFFSLAIQCCLTRLVAEWEKMPLHPTWATALHKAIDSLPNTYRALSAVKNEKPLLLQACSVLNPGNALHLEGFMQEVRSKLKSSLRITLDPKHLDSTLSSELWYSDLDSVPFCLVKEGIKYALMEILKDSRSSGELHQSKVMILLTTGNSGIYSST